MGNERMAVEGGKNVRLDVRLCLHGGRLCVGIMGGDGSPHPRGQRGGRAVREPPLRVVNNEGFSSMGAIYFHSNHGGGRPRGTPLRGLGKIRKWEGRCGPGGEGWVPACARTTGGGGMGSVEEAPSAVGFVEGNRHCGYCQTASRMPMTA